MRSTLCSNFTGEDGTAACVGDGTRWARRPHPAQPGVQSTAHHGQLGHSGECMLFFLCFYFLDGFLSLFVACFRFFASTICLLHFSLKLCKMTGAERFERRREVPGSRFLLRRRIRHELQNHGSEGMWMIWVYSVWNHIFVRKVFRCCV